MHQNDRLPTRHDSLYLFGGGRNRCPFWYFTQHNYYFQKLNTRRVLRCSTNLPDYLNQQNMLQGQYPGAKIHNNDFIGGFSYNIFVGVSVAWIFGAAFFFDLFWPERHESRAVRLAWRICAVITTVMMLGSALTISVRDPPISGSKARYYACTRRFPPRFAGR
jgi:hypothetical protein